MIEDAAPIILPSLLEAFPELREGYAVMTKETRIGYECLTEQDIEDMRSIHEIHNFAPHDDSQPGDIIVLENLLVPLIIELSKSRQRSSRLIEAMQWVEEMAVSSVFAVSNGIACGVCEPLQCASAGHRSVHGEQDKRIVYDAVSRIPHRRSYKAPVFLNNYGTEVCTSM